MEAIREIVINMIIHRDYRATSDSVVKVFDNYIEFYNPGKLPEDITVRDLLTGNYKSTPRNRKIADFFKNMGWIEKYGSGIGRIRDFFKEYGLPEPEFKLISEGFQVTVFGINIKEEQTGGQTGGQSLSETQAMIISFIEENPKISRKELSSFLNINTSAIQKHIDKLKQAGILQREGGDFGGYWKVIENIVK